MSDGLLLSWRNRAIRLRARNLPRLFWPSLVLPYTGWFLHLRVRRNVGDASTAWLLRTGGIDGRDSMRARVVFIGIRSLVVHTRESRSLRACVRRHRPAFCAARLLRVGVWRDRLHRMSGQHVRVGIGFEHVPSDSQRHLLDARSNVSNTLRARHVWRRPWGWVLPGRPGILCRDSGRGVAAGVRGRHLLAGWRIVMRRLSGRIFLGGCRVVVQRLSGRQRLGSWQQQLRESGVDPSRRMRLA